MLDLESFVEDLLGKDLVLDHVDGLRQALVLLAFFCHRHLHLPHCIVSFVDLRLTQFYIPLKRLYGHLEVLDDLAELYLLSFLLCRLLDLFLSLLVKFLLLCVQFSDSDLEFNHALLEPIALLILLLDRILQVLNRPITFFELF